MSDNPHHNMNSGLTPRQRHYDSAADPSSQQKELMSGSGDYLNVGDAEEQPIPSPIQLQQQESHTRSILKGVTWRFVASMTTITIAFLVTGEVGVAFQIGVVEFIAKIGIYYAHERLWLQVPI